MAGAQNIGEPSDNPVAINVTAIVDIVFCLCLFFMTTIHFKALESKIEAWMPKERGPQFTPAPLMEQIRVRLAWIAETGRTARYVGGREARTDTEFGALLRSYSGVKDLPVAVDASADVPWRDAVKAIDLCRQEGLDRVEFTAPAR